MFARAAAGVLAAAVGALPAQDARPADDAETELQRVVFRAWPEADGYRRITRDVAQRHRQQVEAALPFRLHFDEIGRHTLVVAFRGRRPVGLIYRRTEEADWGLMEIAWHLTLDLRIGGLQVLRGRNRFIGGLPRSRFGSRLQGRDFDGLVKLLQAHEGTPQDDRDRDLVSLERTVLHSAAKSLAVIRAVWADDVETLADRADGFDEFPAAARFTRGATRVQIERTMAPDAASVAAAVEPEAEATDASPPAEPRDFDVKVLYAYDLDGDLLGYVAWTREVGLPHEPVRWTIDRDLRVVRASSERTRLDVEFGRACTRIQGQLLTAGRDDDDHDVAVVARSLGAVIPRLARPGGRR